jgi:flagella basal body P-ring formation protein FlgA
MRRSTYYRHCIRIGLAALLAAGSTTVAAAEPSQSHETILEAARQHVLDQGDRYPSLPEVQTGKLDSRLRLAACDLPLETFSPPSNRQTGKITVGVRCTGAKTWTLYVPVTVIVMSDVVTAAKELRRGQILTAQDLTIEQHDIARLHRGYLANLKEAVGKRVKYNIRRGQVITPAKVATPKAVKRNSRVTIVAQNPAIQVRMKGTALESGAVGDRIRVRNNSSKRELEAMVLDRGVVQVTL